MEVESGDAIKLILQFLKENGLNNSVKALQEETRQVTITFMSN